MLPFVVSGIATGAIYGLAATGLVLSYKTSGIFNFGHGALATAAAYCFYWLHVDHELDAWIAFVVSVFVVGPILGLAMELIARRLAVRAVVWKIVGTTGLILIVQGLGSIRYGPDPLPVPPYLPSGRETFRLLGVNVRYDQVMVTTISLVAVIGLYWLFRATRLGIAMRAVVDDPDLVDLLGTNPIFIRRVAWIISSTFAALSGVLLVSFVGLEPVALTFLVVQAFGAAALGGFSNIPATYVGGIVLGIVADVSKKYVLDISWLGGLPASLPFIVLFVVLLVTPGRRLAAPSSREVRPPLPWHGPLGGRLVAGVVVTAFLVAVPSFVDTKLAFWTSGLTQVILLLSLGLLVRTAGMVSLATATFAAIGAVAMHHFVVGLEVPWVLSLVLAGLVAVPVGAVIAVPSIRLSGMFLALATFGFGIMAERLLFARSFMFTTFGEGRRVPRPGWASSDEAYYYLVLAVAFVAVVLIVAIHQARMGRILRGLADSPTAVRTLGLDTNLTRVIVFCVASFLASVAGALYGGLVTFASPSDRYYQSFTSLILVALLALAPFREPWYALFALVAAIIPAYVLGPNTAFWLNVIFGLSAVVVALEGGPVPMPLRLRHLFDRTRRRRERDRSEVIGVQHAAIETRPRGSVVPEGAVSGLEVRDLGVRFGGLIAVDGLSLTAPTGRITGLIGPNGAGKTTTFNVCSGLQRHSSGRVYCNGHDITRHSPSRRARAGLGRTFQRMQLCESLSVADNVALGRESSQAGNRVLSQVVASGRELAVRAASVTEAMELCGIADLRRRQAGSLSTGQRRLVELARALAGPFQVLMLDEPSSGLDGEESEAFGALLEAIVAERGCGVLLVEHDMSLVMQVCSYIHVLDFGRPVFEGTPAEVMASPTVRAAYLGADFKSDLDPEEV